MSNTYSVSNVNVGTTANDGQGDPLRTAFVKINQNFANVYAYANLAYYNGQGGGGTNVIYYNNNFTNVTYYNNTTANLSGYVNLSDLNNALANVSAVDLTRLNNALANVNIQLGILSNVMANVKPVSLSDLNNALANVSNTTSLGYLGNVISSIAANANAIAKVTLVSNLSANGTANGQQVYNTTDGGLYIWRGNAWISPQAAFTPTASSLATIEIWNSTPLPTSNLFDGRTVLYNADSNLYIYKSNIWTNYNFFIQGSGTPVVSAGSITATMLAASAVTAGKIAAGAIGAAEIAANAITSNLLAANSVIAGKVAAGVISATEIAAGAITASKIGADAIYAGAIQANAITAGKIATNAIYADNIAANQITTAKIAANAITATEIAASSIYAYQLTASSVTAASIATNAVYAGAIQSNAITADKIAANAITAVKVAANSIYGNSIMAGTITGDRVAANSITAAQIDSRGLVIRNASGDIIVSAGYISGNIPVAITGGGTTTLANIASASNITAKWLMLNNDFPGFGVANGAAVNTSNITLTANLQGMTGTATFSVIGGSATLTNTSDSNAKKLLFTNMNTDSVTIKAEYSDSGTIYSDIVSLYKVYNGNTTPLMYLTDENRTLAADQSGTVSSFTGVSTTAAVYLGLVDDTSNWTFVATATNCTISQSGTGNKTISVTAMAADTASVTIVGSRSGYANQTRVYKLSKAKQGPQGLNGANGTNGLAGVRGQIRTSYVASAWYDIFAATAIYNATGSYTPRITDEVTIYDNSTKFSETRTWDGSAWTTAVATFNGSILIDGSIIAGKIATNSIYANNIVAGEITTGLLRANAITASKIAAGAITADKITASNATIASTGMFGFGSGTNVKGYGAVGAFETTSTTNFGVIGASDNINSGVVAANRGSSLSGGTAMSFWRFRNGTYASGATNVNCNGTLGGWNVPISFTTYNTDGTTNGGGSFGTYGTAAAAFNQNDYLGTSVAEVQLGLATGEAIRVFKGTIKNAAGTVVAFTGSHDGLVLPNETIELGDILVDVDIVARRDVSDAISTLTKSTQINQKSVFGVLRSYAQENYIPYCLAEEYQEENPGATTIESPTPAMIWKERLNPIHQTLVDTYKFVYTNSIGEGLINVCGENGNIEIGDLITSSSIPGKGMRQDDDLIRSYTVAKARETVTFSSPTEVKQIACTYHCG